MRVILFSSQTYDRDSFLGEPLPEGVELQFQPARLNLDTVALAEHHEVVCAFINDDLSAPVLEHLGCKVLVLCPTTEQMLFNQSVPNPNSQLQAKPACTRKLRRALADLISPRPLRSEPGEPLSSRAPRVLCVDDNPANLLLVQTLLEDMGAKVHAVESGYAAIDAVKQETFDLVLMDVQMPGMDGRQSTEAIRQWESERHGTPLPVVALTAHAMANEKRALLQSGMDDYLTKPISERQLAQVV